MVIGIHNCTSVLNGERRERTNGDGNEEENIIRKNKASDMSDVTKFKTVRYLKPWQQPLAQ